MNYGSFKAFADQAEPGMRERGYEWLTAIGLQEVDGLTVSDCLLDLAARNIEGEIRRGGCGRSGGKDFQSDHPGVFDDPLQAFYGHLSVCRRGPEI